MKAEIEEAYERLLAEPGVVFLLGGLDSGKTTFGVELLGRASEAGISSALVDADVGQSTSGPPTTVGLRFCDELPVVDRDSLKRADGLAFVGSYSPRLHLLPLVAGTAKLAVRARAAGCRLIVIDTTGLVSGVYGQMLKLSKMDLVAPDWLIAFRRGGELEPVIGIAQRFTPASVIEIDVAGEIEARSVEERISFRERQFASYFSEGTLRWRIKPAVFMPTLPPEFDLTLLDSLVVGMDDGKGSCVGIGVLEADPEEEILRMVSPVAEGVRGLRLGSVKIDVSGRSKGPVDIRQLFGSE